LDPSRGQIFVLITLDRDPSTPVDEYDVTAKYQVPEARLLTVSAVSPGFDTFRD